MEQPVARYRKYAMPSRRNGLALLFFAQLTLIGNISPKSLKSGRKPQGFAAASNFTG
jgi:hypothetical protein